MRQLLLFSLFFLIAGCAAIKGYQLDQRFGAANPSRFDRISDPLAVAKAPVEYCAT
ncbi:MAG: hypothetical protein ACOYMG_08860 [Candidatus Methylumidiphilus sp.]